MKSKTIVGASLAFVFGSSAAAGAPVYLDCAAFGKEFQGGQVHYAFTLYETAQSASKIVKETGYTQARLVAAFSSVAVTIHEPGEFESNDYTINRSSLSLKIMTSRDGKAYDGGSGTCKIAAAPERKF